MHFLFVCVCLCVCTCWVVDFQSHQSAWGKPSRSSGLLSHLWTNKNTLCLLFDCKSLTSISRFACMHVITFRMNVTPSSKRMPRLGDAELQRRKQSPSRRAGRMPVIWRQHTEKDGEFIAFSSIFQVSETTRNVLRYLWGEAPGLGVLGVIGCPHCVDVAQNLE